MPFLVRYPRRIGKGLSTSAFVTPVDILPTLLSLSGIDFDADRFDGIDPELAGGGRRVRGARECASG